MPLPNKAITTPTSSAPKPAMPSTPPPELMKQTFDTAGLPSLDKAEGSQVISTEHKDGSLTELKVEAPTEIIKAPVKEEVKEEVAKEEPKVEKETTEKEEVKEDDTYSKLLKPPKGKEVEKKDEVKGATSKDEPIKLPSKSEDPFDYTGFDNDDISILKPLSLNARKKVAEKLKENRELKNTSYLQHPGAYALSPDYKKAQEEVQYMSLEGQIWGQQLEKCKSGKTFNELLGFDKNGKPVYGPEVQPTDAHEEALRARMNSSFNGAQNLQSRMQVYAQQFGQQTVKDVQAIEAYRKGKFPWIEKPELLDYTINIGGEEKSIKQIRSDIIGLFPPYLRNLVPTQIVGDLVVGLAINTAEINSLKGNKQKQVVKEQEEEKVEPTSTIKPASQDSNGKVPWGKVKEFSLAGLPADMKI